VAEVEEIGDDEGVQLLVVGCLGLCRVEAGYQGVDHLGAQLGMALGHLLQRLHGPGARPDVVGAVEEVGTQRRQSGRAEAAQALGQQLVKPLVIPRQ
jgi:hypothetical protein